MNSKPRFIFQLSYKDPVVLEDFQILKEQHGSVTGYHGSPLENFHSILRRGLNVKFGKSTSLFGEGIYLALDNRVSENFFSLGDCWKNSSCTTKKIGCIVACEVISHPQEVRFVGSDKTSSNPTSPPMRLSGSHYVVANSNELVQVKSILVYEGGEKEKHRWWEKFLHNVSLLVCLLIDIGGFPSLSFQKEIIWSVILLIFFVNRKKCMCII